MGAVVASAKNNMTSADASFSILKSGSSTNETMRRQQLYYNPAEMYSHLNKADSPASKLSDDERSFLREALKQHPIFADAEDELQNLLCDAFGKQIYSNNESFQGK